MSAYMYTSIIIDGMDQAEALSTMSANMYVSIIIDGMDQAKTMLPHFYYVCKYECIYNNRRDGPIENNDATFLLCLQINMYL